jgi:endogenous inhibitor of DNA gyrase (YacG/DUF329 family)
VDKLVILHLDGATMNILQDNNALMAKNYHPKTEVRNACMVKLYSSGRGIQEIADMYEVSRQRVDQILRAEGAEMRPRHTVDTVTFNCKECGTETTRKKYAHVKLLFCSLQCNGIWRKKNNPIKTPEQIRTRNNARMKAYRSTPKGFEISERVRHKYLASPKYREWHKRFHGYYPGEATGLLPKNKEQKCAIEGCERMTFKKGRLSKLTGQPLWSKTCNKHRTDGSLVYIPKK